MNDSPVLLLLFNRPGCTRDLVSRLEEISPKKILVAVDGPRANSITDTHKIQEVLQIAESINWTDDVTFRIRDLNLGLRGAVTDAVTWAMSEYGKAIILEDDTLPTPNFFEFCNWSLKKFESTPVGHISGYNVIAPKYLSSDQSLARLSRYPESFAWATWSDKWSLYNDNLDWAKEASIPELKKFCGSTLAALNWKRAFYDAKSFRVDSWAYRWIASLWANNLYCLSPNTNLVTYNGYVDGTHTQSKASWQELPTGSISLENINSSSPTVDFCADKWIERHVFGGSISGFSKGLLQSTALEIRALRRRNDRFSPRGRHRFEKN